MGIESVEGVAQFEVRMEDLAESDWDLPLTYRRGDDSEHPTEQQREQLCKMMALAFVEIRALGWSDQAAQAADLADTFHNLPYEMYGQGSWSWKRMRRLLAAYQDKYYDTGQGPEYVARLDALREGLPQEVVDKIRQETDCS